MASPVLEGLLSRYQSLGVASSTRRTYQTGLRAFQQFCYQYSIPVIPASPLTLRYFCCSIAHKVSHKTIKVYLAGIRLEHIERGFQDPTNDELLRLLCKGIKRSHGTNRRTRLPITINILRTLKCKLRDETSYSLLEKRLLWSAFTLAFYGFLRASEFTTPELTWSHIQRHTDKVTVFIQQSKTDPFRQGHTMAIYATETSTCPVRAINQYADEITTAQQVGPLFHGGRFSPLTRQQLTSALRHLLQHTEYNQQHYASHSFRIGAATTAAAAGLPAWLIKILGRWSSEAYQSYIHPSPMVLQSVPSLLARTDTSQQSPWDPDAANTPVLSTNTLLP